MSVLQAFIPQGKFAVQEEYSDLIRYWLADLFARRIRL